MKQRAATRERRNKSGDRDMTEDALIGLRGTPSKVVSTKAMEKVENAYKELSQSVGDEFGSEDDFGFNSVIDDFSGM